MHTKRLDDGSRRNHGGRLPSGLAASPDETGGHQAHDGDTSDSALATHIPKVAPTGLNAHRPKQGGAFSRRTVRPHRRGRSTRGTLLNTGAADRLLTLRRQPQSSENAPQPDPSAWCSAQRGRHRRRRCGVLLRHGHCTLPDSWLVGRNGVVAGVRRSLPRSHLLLRAW